MTRPLIVGYLTAPAGAGLRVWADGEVELSRAGDRWRAICTLEPDEVERLAAATRAAGIPELPSIVAAPPGLRDGPDCEWRTDLGDRPLRSVIHGWSDANPAAAPSRALVMELSALVSGAQARS